MSGPKKARVDVSREIAAAIAAQVAAENARRQREREAQIERERQRAAAVARQTAVGELERARQARAKANQAGAEQWAGAEVGSAGQALAQAERAFVSGSYEGGDFARTGKFAGIAATAFEQARLAALERQEAERIRREAEQQKAEARGAIARAERTMESLDRLPHAKFAPGELATVGRVMGEARRFFDAGGFVGTLAAAQSAAQSLRELEEKVTRQYDRWQQERAAAEQAIQAVREAMAGVDRQFANTWAKGRLEGIAREAAALEADLNREDFRACTGGGPAIVERVGALQAEAAQAYEREQRRFKVVSQMLDTLEGMGFTVDSRLADDGDPAGAVVVKAMHPSGRKMSFNVNQEMSDIHLDLDDDQINGSRSGADCVTDINTLIEKLERQGVEMTMTDWGRADPSRRKPGAQARSRQSEKREQRER